MIQKSLNWAKPATSVSVQVSILEQRNMTFSDKTKAENILLCNIDKVKYLDKVGKYFAFSKTEIKSVIKSLADLRNQCAHPAMDNNDELFTPSRYEADALIYRMLKDILTIPAMFTNKITDYITEQISKIAGYSEFKWKDKNQLSKSFLKYFKRMNDAVFVKVFKDMWKLTFFTSNDECDKNRFSNMLFLDIMLRERHTVIIDAMKSQKEYFNKISSDAKVNKYLSILIYRNNYLLSFLDDTTRSFIKNSKYEMPDVRLFAWFAFDTKEEYIDNLFKENAPQKFSDIILDNYKYDSAFLDVKDYFKKSIIKYYIESSSFNDADKNFNDLIYPLSDELSKEEILKIIEDSENNVQLTRRYEYITSDDRGRKLKELVDGANITFEEISQFKHFAKFYTNYSDNDTSLSNTDDDSLPF